MSQPQVYNTAACWERVQYSRLLRACPIQPLAESVSNKTIEEKVHRHTRPILETVMMVVVPTKHWKLCWSYLKIRMITRDEKYRVQLEILPLLKNCYITHWKFHGLCWPQWKHGLIHSCSQNTYPPSLIIKFISARHRPSFQNRPTLTCRSWPLWVQGGVHKWPFPWLSSQRYTWRIGHYHPLWYMTYHIPRHVQRCRLRQTAPLSVWK